MTYNNYIFIIADLMSRDSYSLNFDEMFLKIVQGIIVKYFKFNTIFSYC